jgi:hypothetical protein
VLARSYVIESKESCHTIAHHIRDLGSTWSIGTCGGQVLCRPSPSASRIVSPKRHQLVPAFMLLVMTLPMTSRACMLSKFGCDKKFVNRKHSKLQQTANHC